MPLDIPVGEQKAKRKNRFQIRGTDKDKYGGTEDCLGCERHYLGLSQRAHTEECRDRIAQKLMEDGDPAGRVLRDVDRRLAQRELVRELAKPVQEDTIQQGGENEEVDEPEDVNMGAVFDSYELE